MLVELANKHGVGSSCTYDEVFGPGRYIMFGDWIKVRPGLASRSCTPQPFVDTPRQRILPAALTTSPPTPAALLLAAAITLCQSTPERPSPTPRLPTFSALVSVRELMMS